ncbi:MAG: hypothetical protein NT135_00165 [Candidatus Berkelbacteria bacterium]|nr:hypothetical protein [Candidatus Berkelbacteria bacterium]
MSRLQKSPVNSDHTIKFTTPSGVTDASDTIEITFPAGFSVTSVDVTDIDLHWGPSTGLENSATLAAAADATHWGAYFTGQVLSFDHATDGAFEDIATTSKVVVEIGTNATGGDQQIDNHATAATYTISIGGDFGDTGKIAVVILDNDQFTVSASVDPTITFSLDNTATAFGTLSGTIATSSPNVTLTVSTNTNSGYTLTVQDQGSGSNPGLWNSDASFLIGSADYSYNNSADLSSVAGYGIQCSSASATCQSPYNVSGTNVGGYERTAQNFATYDGIADSHTVTITSKAKVSGSTPAGSYNDTVTVIATGNF